MDMIGKEEWHDLLRLVEDIEEALTHSDSQLETAWDRCADALKTLSSTAAMLGMDGLAKAGVALEAHLEQKVRSNGGASGEATMVFQFAVNALTEQMRQASHSKGGQDIDAREIVSLVEAPSENAAQMPQRCPDASVSQSEPETDEDSIIDQLVGAPSQVMPSQVEDDDQSHAMAVVEEFCRRLQGTVQAVKNPEGVLMARLEVPLTEEMVNRLQGLLDPTGRLEDLRQRVSEDGQMTDTVLGTIKNFMRALSDGDLQRAEEILGQLAENRHPGLYKEIGGIARELHNSLRDFVRTMDPSLREMVEEKIPDSGNRLEHIIKLTESAANTTLDHVEALQKRNEKDQGRLETIAEVLSGLQPLGENAQKKLGEAVTLIQDLLASARKSHEDLIKILTAQDYQDLTGQIIMKIIALLEDLEAKLVKLIAKFGVKVEKARCTKEELYGPAHEAMADALHSQSDVDALLAEFGF